MDLRAYGFRPTLVVGLKPMPAIATEKFETPREHKRTYLGYHI